MTPTPSAVSRRTTANSVSISPSSRIADGSSMISSRTSPDSARAIETIWRAAGRSARTFTRGGPRAPALHGRGDLVVAEAGQQRRGLAAHRLATQQRAAARLVPEEDRL